MAQQKKDGSYIVGPGQVDIRPPEVPDYNINQAAQRDVSLFNQPQLQEIAGQANQVRDAWKEQDVASQNIHRGLMNELGQMPNINQQYNQGAQQYNQHVGGLAQQFNQFGAGPAHEAQADAGLMQSMGQGAHAALLGQRNRAQDWSRGIQGQAGVDLANRRANYLENMRDEIQKLQMQRMGIFSGMSDQLKQRKTELADQRFGQGLGLWESGMQAESMASDDELREAIIGIIGDQMGGKGGGNNSGSGGGSGSGSGGGNSGKGGKGYSYNELLDMYNKRRAAGHAGDKFLKDHTKFAAKLTGNTGGTGSGPGPGVGGPKGKAASTSNSRRASVKKGK